MQKKKELFFRGGYGLLRCKGLIAPYFILQKADAYHNKLLERFPILLVAHHY